MRHPWIMYFEKKNRSEKFTVALVLSLRSRHARFGLASFPSARASRRPERREVVLHGSYSGWHVGASRGGVHVPAGLRRTRLGFGVDAVDRSRWQRQRDKSAAPPKFSALCLTPPHFMRICIYSARIRPLWKSIDTTRSLFASSEAV